MPFDGLHAAGVWWWITGAVLCFTVVIVTALKAGGGAGRIPRTLGVTACLGAGLFVFGAVHAGSEPDHLLVGHPGAVRCPHDMAMAVEPESQYRYPGTGSDRLDIASQGHDS